MFEHALVYTYEKLYLMAALLAGIILTTVLAAHAYSANLYRWRKNTLLALLFVVLTLQTGQFLAVVSPPSAVGLFVKLQGIGLCLLGPLFFLPSSRRAPSPLSASAGGAHLFVARDRYPADPVERLPPLVLHGVQ